MRHGIAFTPPVVDPAASVRVGDQPFAGSARDGQDHRPGLVICAISGRGSVLAGQTVGDVFDVGWSARFPSGELVDVAAGLLPSRVRFPRGVLAEGPRCIVSVAPGLVSVSRPDWARRDRTANRQADSRVPVLPGRGEARISEFSRRSQGRMVRTMLELDWTPLVSDGLVPAMVTLTYPGDFEAVGAADPAVCAGHLVALRRSWRRSWGAGPSWFWKREFQRRGAPHFHILAAPPRGSSALCVTCSRRVSAGRGAVHPTCGVPFRMWLSESWARIVGATGEERRKHLAAGTAVDFAEGMRCSDPRRAAVYFLKHSAGGSGKAYQNRAPDAIEATGRWWGYAGLLKVIRGVDVEPAVGQAVVRTLRRLARSHARRRIVRGPRRGDRVGSRTVQPVRRVSDPITGEVIERRRRRPVRRVVPRMRGSSGWLAVNNGPMVLAQIALGLRC